MGRRIVLAALVAATAFLLTLALPVREWRTGDQGRLSLDALPEAPPAIASRRIWIDTDAACGHKARTDPDDCLAIALLARAAELRIAGISVVAGNASLEAVERTTRELAGRLAAETGHPLPVHAGTQGLRAALADGPLSIVALGPLTNIAALLLAEPDAAARIQGIVAVMGRRPGHLFHPAEGAAGAMLLGHGPIFRDLNFALDPQAAARVLESGLPLTLVPYDAARGLELGAPELDRIAATGATGPWLAARAHPWLEFWREDIGRAGFYPFDLLAAAYVLHPSLLRCVSLRARVARDDTLFVPFWRPHALLVERPDAGPPGGAIVRYCGQSREGLKPSVMNRLGAGGP